MLAASGIWIQSENKYASLVPIDRTMIRNSKEYDESFIVLLVYRAIDCRGLG